MKKLLPFILILGLVLPIQPASAAVSCKSIKSKILVIEKKVLAELSYFEYTAVVGVDEYDKKIVKMDNYLRLKAFSKKTWLNDIWKLGINNSKCFTTSQKITLRDPAFKSYSSYLQWEVVPIGFEDDDQSILIEFPEEYQSIYQY